MLARHPQAIKDLHACGSYNHNKASGVKPEDCPAQWHRMCGHLPWGASQSVFSRKSLCAHHILESKVTVEIHIRLNDT